MRVNRNGPMLKPWHTWAPLWSNYRHPLINSANSAPAFRHRQMPNHILTRCIKYHFLPRGEVWGKFASSLQVTFLALVRKGPR
ncbi:hypothetical protein BDZ94DRAFT_1253510 [Collybia nuda]|uniref:Uncharacterized protein n=1 Tax=Collybia nuda TaxID=64659 RepID=A0A9P5Y8N6_9AGAR|nr:hypothetical protein BDZ94DRAFT_1253510 [Collybia nuda]